MDRGRLISLIAGLALIAAALPGVSAAQDQPAVNIVEPSPTDALGWGFDPVNLSVAAGQTVTWTNTGAQQHTVTADDMSLDSGLIDPAGIAPITETFLREPRSPAWSRVWAMVTLGHWFEQHRSAPVLVQ